MSLSSALLARSPALYVRFQNAAGTPPVDSSTNALPLTSTGVTYGAESLVPSDPTGKSASFSSYGHYVSAGNPAALQYTGAASTVAVLKPYAWAQAADGTDASYATIAGKGYDGTNEGRVLRAQSVSGTVRKLAYYSYAAAGTDIVEFDISSNWSLESIRLAIGVLDPANNQARLYLNGVRVATAPCSFGARATTAPYIIGAESMSGVVKRGAIMEAAEVADFPSALTDADVAALWAEMNGINPTAAINASGTTLTLTFPGTTTGVAAADYRLSSGEALSAASGSGATWTMTIAPALPRDRKPKLAYVKPGSGGTVVGGSALASFAGLTIASASTAVGTLRAAYPARKLGAFLHFGIETFLPVAKEWSDGNEAETTYAPTSLNVDQWVGAILGMGATYAVLTAKHHGGFCLWNSAVTTHDVIAAGQADVVALYAAKVRAAGLGVGLYFSIWDKWWQRQNPSGTPAQYTAYLKSQLTELLDGRYGAIDMLWTDGWGWNYPGSPENGDALGDTTGYTNIPWDEIYAHIKSLQPNCLLVENGHKGATLENTDVAVFEGPITGLPASGNTVPGETCDTIFKTAGGGDLYFTHDTYAAPALKYTAAQVKSLLDTVQARSSALLINTPPGTSGQMSSALVARMAEIGALLNPAVPAITSPAAATATAGRGWSYQIAASNTPTGFSATGLPAGLQLLAGTPWIVGTPPAPGAYSVTLGASNSGGAAPPVTLALTVAAGVGLNGSGILGLA